MTASGLISRLLRDHRRWLTAPLALSLALAAHLPLEAAAPKTGNFERSYHINGWGTDDGLPDNSTSAMVQAPDGYLWLASFGGLVRFNGVSFTAFDVRNAPGLPSDRIVNLHLDASRRLWVSTDRGLAVSEPDQWTKLRLMWRHPRDTSIRNFSENAGVICATTNEGRILRIADGQVTELPPPSDRPGRCSGYVDPAGTIWVVSQSCFVHWAGDRWEESALGDPLKKNLQAAVKARDGSLLVLNDRTLSRIREGRLVSTVPLSNEIKGVWSIGEDRQGIVWVGTVEQGLFRIAPDGETWNCRSHGLTESSVRFAFEDREGNLWAGGSGLGLLRLKPTVFESFGTAHGLPESNVKAVAEDAAGNILVGLFRRGLVRLEEERTVPISLGDGLGLTALTCLLTDHAGQTWAGTRGAGLFVYDQKSWRSISPDLAGGNRSFALFEDSSQRIWIGGEETVSMWANGNFQRPEAGASPSLRFVRCFAEDTRNKSIWAATSEGLFRHEGGGWQEVKAAAGQPLAEIHCLRTEPDGTLWVGGAYVGLLRLRKGLWSAVTTEHGLPTPHITCILDDQTGNWWLGSTRGVLRVARADLEQVADGAVRQLPHQLFTMSDGLPSLECARDFQSTGMRDRQGRLWFATLKGVAMVDPARLRLNTAPAPVVIEEFRLEGEREMRYPSVAGGGPIQVDHRTREIKVTISCLSYVAPEKTRFKFRTDGIDPADLWHDIKNRRTIYFYLPPPGAYRLHVRAANNDGVWNPQEAVLDFFVRPTFWQSAWFKLLLAGVAAGVVVTLVRWRVRRVRQREQELRRINAELEQRVQARTTELATRVTEVEELNRELETFSYSVSHDLRAPLRNITGFLELLTRRAAARLDDEDKRFVQTVSSEARRMSVLVDELLALSRIGRAELVLQPVRLAELIDEVRAELQPELGSRRIAWQVARLPEVHGDRILLRQVVANLLANAVKFTRRCEEAVIEIGTIPPTTDEPQVTFFVRDNGAGFNPKYAEKLFGVFQRLHSSRDFEGTGIGLAIVERIIERHGGRVWAEGQVDKGAVFYFIIPSP